MVKQADFDKMHEKIDKLVGLNDKFVGLNNKMDKLDMLILNAMVACLSNKRKANVMHSLDAVSNPSIKEIDAKFAKANI